MNKAFYIVGIVFSVLFIGIINYYSEEVSSAKFDYYFDDIFSSGFGYDSYSYSSYSSSAADDLTSEAALWSLLFILCFIAIDLLGLIKVKTRTVKVLSIIGLSLSAIFLLWNFAVMASPGSLSFDEVGPGFGFYATVMLAFTIVGLVQSNRYARKLATAAVSQTVAREGSDLLDS